jgi:hypothetical protein
MSEMITDGSARDTAIIDREFVTRLVWENLEVIRAEVEHMRDSSATRALTTLLDEILRPLAEAVSEAREHRDVYRAANAYLFMVPMFVLRRLPDRRQEAVLLTYERASAALLDYERGFIRVTPDLTPIAMAIADGFEVSTERLGAGLDHISHHLNDMTSKIEMIATEREDRRGATLSSVVEQLRLIDTTLIESMTQLVGPFRRTRGGTTAGAPEPAGETRRASEDIPEGVSVPWSRMASESAARTAERNYAG